MKRILLYVVIFFVVVTGAAVLFSPYGNNGLPYKAISHSVDIKVPVEKVFNYLGNSANASTWSVFVDHITPLNPSLVADGEQGSIRRCYTDSAEKKMQWDELILEVRPNVKRQLTIYNMVDFPMQADSLATEQLYERTGDSSTRLTFTVFFEGRPSLWDEFKMYLGAYRIKPIFRSNMNNIKSILESESRQ